MNYWWTSRSRDFAELFERSLSKKFHFHYHHHCWVFKDRSLYRVGVYLNESSFLVFFFTFFWRNKAEERNGVRALLSQVWRRAKWLNVTKWAKDAKEYFFKVKPFLLSFFLLLFCVVLSPRFSQRLNLPFSPIPAEKRCHVHRVTERFLSVRLHR